jgi:hypothetical protein
MPENEKEVLKTRTESHSDVADTPPARQHQAANTERQFGAALLTRLRQATTDIRLHNFQEEWISADDGLAHELRVEIVTEE